MKISIITATWNRADTIKDTIESILAQSYQDWEHIIVDGASTDNTLGIIEKYEKEYNGRLKVISEPDKGIYDAMNKGIAMASGEVVGFLNSDDLYFDCNSLSRIADCLTDKDIDAFHADNMIVRWEDINQRVRIHTNAGFKVSQMKFGIMPSHPTFYCRKNVFEKYGGFDTTLRIAGDFDWLLRVIYVQKIRLSYNPGFLTKMRAGGLSQGGLKSHMNVMKEHMRSYKKYGVKSTILHEFCRFGYKCICRLLKISY